jgi:hypothetical protein
MLPVPPQPSNVLHYCLGFHLLPLVGVGLGQIAVIFEIMGGSRMACFK